MPQTVSAADFVGFRNASGNPPPALTLTAAVAAGDYVCFAIINDGTQASSGATYDSVASLANNSGLSFTRRFIFENDQTAGGTSKNNMELWVAKSAGIISGSTLTVTPTMTALVDAAVEAVWKVTGCDPTTPFDPNGSLPARAVNTTSSASAPSVSGVNTTNTDTVLFGFFGSPQNGLPAPPAGWTTLVSTSYALGSTNFADMVIGYKVVSAAQSSLAVNFTNNEGVWQLVVDAMQAAAPPIQKSYAVLVG